MTITVLLRSYNITVIWPLTLQLFSLLVFMIWMRFKHKIPALRHEILCIPCVNFRLWKAKIEGFPQLFFHHKESNIHLKIKQETFNPGLLYFYILHKLCTRKLEYVKIANNYYYILKVKQIRRFKKSGLLNKWYTTGVQFLVIC